MGKVYIGVMVVGGHKLWGGERWKIDGRRRGGCGPGMPGPYRVVEGCAGVGWFRAIFVGGAASSTCRGGVKTPPYDVGVRRGV